MLSLQHHVETLLSVRKVYEASKDYEDVTMHSKKKINKWTESGK